MNRLKLPNKKARIGVLLFFISPFSCGPQAAVLGRQDSNQEETDHAEPYIDADAYQIYATLLKDAKGTPLLIQAETESSAGSTTANMGIKGSSKFMKLWGTAMKDYAARYRTPRLFLRDFSLAARYELVPANVLHHWKMFTEPYPTGRGYYFFSAVGFNPKKTRAIVDLGYLCGGLCGHGEYHFLEKSGGKWHEVSVDAECESWVS